MIQPNYDRWKQPVFSYSSLSDFLSVHELESGIHAININGHTVDFLFQKRASDALLVVFNAAAPRNPENVPPFFSGNSIAAGANCSLLAINDSSLYLDNDIRLAWYAGSRFLRLQSIIPDIINKVASLSAERIIMTGGSGGGFASLFYAPRTVLPSIAFVYNPQTSIAKHPIPRIANYYSKICWGGVGPWSLEESLLNITFDLVDNYKWCKAPVIYFQNASDQPHIEDHATPFIKNFGLEWTGHDQLTEGLYLHVGEWGDGHVVPPYNLVLQVLKNLKASKASWNESIPLVAETVAQARQPIK